MSYLDKRKFNDKKNPPKMNYMEIKKNQMRTEAIYSELAIERESATLIELGSDTKADRK